MKDLVLLVLLVCISWKLVADTPPVGFEDPVLLTQVQNGELILSRTLDDPKEEIIVGKLFFPGLQPENYIALVEDFQNLSTKFPEIKWVVDKGFQEYSMAISVGFKLYSFETEIIWKHSKSVAGSETILKNQVANYRKTIELADQTTRIIPYENGILIEDTIHVKTTTRSFTPRIARSKLMGIYFSYFDMIKKSLAGRPL